MDTSFKIAGIFKWVVPNQPIYVGSHFTWGEATRNGERLPITTYFDGTWYRAETIAGNIIKITRELDLIRAQFGNKPITVNSWLRPPAINQIVGGASKSQHLLGWAVDIQIEGYDPHDVAAKIAPYWKGGLGDSANFTHLDLRHLLGWQAARWDYGNA